MNYHVNAKPAYMVVDGEARRTYPGIRRGAYCENEEEVLVMVENEDSVDLWILSSLDMIGVLRVYYHVEEPHLDDLVARLFRPIDKQEVTL